MASAIIGFIFLVCCILLFVFALFVPIMIANARGITGGEKTAIIVLSILGIFFGLTWFVALILSLVWQGDGVSGDEFDKLEKLTKLYKDKVITKAEYERLRAKILRE